MTSWVRFRRQGKIAIGTWNGDSITEYDGSLFADPAPTGRTFSLSDVSLLAPVEPRSIIGLWNNFQERAKKEGQTIPEVPLYFMKPVSSIVGPGDVIFRPKCHSGKVIFEAELGIVIGRTCCEATEEMADDHIFGYTCVNDVTAVEILNSDPAFQQWSRCKGFDTFCPIGPSIVTKCNIQGGRVQAVLDGKICQDYPLKDMIFSPQQIVSHLSHMMTLQPGDLIACGTSLGVKTMRSGNAIDIVIEGIGTLSNTYKEHPLSKL